MNHPSTRHKELSEELTSWWHAQDDFKTKKAMAGSLKVHPDTLGDYFRGRQFPKGEIANRLWEFTRLACLKPRNNSAPSAEINSKEVNSSEPSEPTEKSERYGERSVIISFQRANCPFCGQAIEEFRNCVGCGQHFVWANVPLSQ